MSGCQEAVATCTGERTDRGPARLRQQTENGSSGSTRGAAGGWRATCTGEQADSRTAPARKQTETGSSGSARGAAGDWWLAGLKNKGHRRASPGSEGWDARCGAHISGRSRVEQHQQ